MKYLILGNPNEPSGHRASCEVGSIITTNLPRADSWTHAQQLLTSVHPELFDLTVFSDINIVVREGEYYALDGSHLLALIAATYGSKTTIDFYASLADTLDHGIDSQGQATAHSLAGITTIHELAVHCLMGDFDYEDHHRDNSPLSTSAEFDELPNYSFLLEDHSRLLSSLS